LVADLKQIADLNLTPFRFRFRFSLYSPKWAGKEHLPRWRRNEVDEM